MTACNLSKNAKTPPTEALIFRRTMFRVGLVVARRVCFRSAFRFAAMGSFLYIPTTRRPATIV